MFKKEFFNYYLMDEDNNLIKQMYNVEKCNVSYSSLSKLKQSAKITVIMDKNEVLNTNFKIRVCYVNDETEHIIGTFLISTPSENLNNMYKTIDIECYSMLWIYDTDKIIERFCVPRGTNVVNEVKRILGDKDLLIGESNLSTSVDLEWEIGTSKVDICNELLETINYTSLYPLPDGTISSEKHLLPENKEILVTYDESEKDNIIESECVSQIDFFDTPNIFVRYVNNPQTKNLVAVYENTNPDSPTSTANRKRNVNAQEVRDASDVQTLMDIAKRDCSNITNKYHTVQFRTAINPIHGFMSCIYLNLNGIQGTFIETEWDMDCECGASMQHDVRKVVIV